MWKTTGAHNLLVRWGWRNLRPLDIVNDEGLYDLLSFLEPGYQLPSRTYVAKQLQLRHKEAFDTLKTNLGDIAGNGISLTSNIWTSTATQAFNTVTAQFIDPQ